MRTIKIAFTALVSFFLFANISFAFTEVEHEGVTYRIQPVKQESVTVYKDMEVGKKIKVDYHCRFTNKTLFMQDKVCSWQKIIVATEHGVVEREGSEVLSEGIYRYETIILSVGIGIMMLSILFFWFEFPLLATATAIIAAIAAIIVIAAAITVAFAIAATAAAIAAASAGNERKGYYIFSSAYIAIICGILISIV